MEFLVVDSVETARKKLISSAKRGFVARENIPITKSLGRILAEDIAASEDIPMFRRSTVDGYAVFSADTAAAGESIPVFLTVKGQVEMGAPADFAIARSECAEIPTGGMLPVGADAVIMKEYSEPFAMEGTALYQSVAFGENVVRIGEDAKAGTVLLKSGKRILPQDIGALAAAGVTNAPVYIPPRVTVLSTGDELISPEIQPRPGQVRDINTYALTAAAEKTGFAVAGSAVLPDDEGALEKAVSSAMEISDIVIVSGGSSKGQKDNTRAVFERISSPGVFTHGISLKPGKPTILGYDETSNTVLAGLPGHPVSAMIVFELLLGWFFREITGSSAPPAVPARISCNFAASPGKLTCQPCRLISYGGWYSAEPVFGKSGLITTLTQADGYFIVPRDVEGLQDGQPVMVHLF